VIVVEFRSSLKSPIDKLGSSPVEDGIGYSLDNEMYGPHEEMLNRFLFDPLNKQNRYEILKFFLEESLIYWTPESFMYYELVDAKWIESQNDDHEIIIDSIIERSFV
jgi:hypothetical protein